MLLLLLAWILSSVLFLLWWKRHRKAYKTSKYEEVLLILFLIKQKDTGKVHQVYFGEISGVIAPTIGNTRGRYENLFYLCPEYEFVTVPGGLVFPKSLKVRDLDSTVGEWIDKYWNKRFEKRKK